MSIDTITHPKLRFSFSTNPNYTLYTDESISSLDFSLSLSHQHNFKQISWLGSSTVVLSALFSVVLHTPLKMSVIVVDRPRL